MVCFVAAQHHIVALKCWPVMPCHRFTGLRRSLLLTTRSRDLKQDHLVE